MRVDKYTDSYTDTDGQILIVKTSVTGTKYYKSNQYYLHRLDGPAIEWKNGDYEWYKIDRRHRIE